MASLVKEKRRDKKKLNRVVINEEINLGPPPSVGDLQTLLHGDIANSEPEEVNADDEVAGSQTNEGEDLLIVAKEAENSKKNVDIPSTTSTDYGNNVDTSLYNDKSIEINEIDHDIQETVANDTCSKVDENESNLKDDTVQEEVTPSAPALAESHVHLEQLTIEEDQLSKIVVDLVTEASKQWCMPLQEAERLFCGGEIAHVKAISKREALIVENMIFAHSDHPLRELLSTFRRSLIALETERGKLAKSVVEEQKFRQTLWTVEKREAVAREQCACGANVEVRARYEHATLHRDRLPMARAKLDTIVRETQESYCHYQHQALLAHSQIEEFLHDTMQTTNSQIRVALVLVLDCLRSSDSSPPVLSEALQRWATAVSSRLLSFGHISDLLFLWHNLFKQNRSVHWSASVLKVGAHDLLESARVVALLDLLLTESLTPTVEAATECTEDIEQIWEEVDQRGVGCCVAGNALRERDLLAIVDALPLQDLVARLALIRHQDIKEVTEYEWGDGSGGCGVVKAVCGVRVLVATLRRGVDVHPHYGQLAGAARALTAQSLRALADLYSHTKSGYTSDLAARISVELEAAFHAGWALYISTGASPEHLPYTLLTAHTAREYVSAFITHLHAEESVGILNSDEVSLPASVGCKQRVQILAAIAKDRTDDHALAKVIIDYLLKVSFAREHSLCPCRCHEVARTELPRMLIAHAYLYAETLCTFGYFKLGEDIEASHIELLSPINWMPTYQEIRAVMSSLSSRNLSLLPPLLLSLDFTPHTGIPLETQLEIAWFLSHLVKEQYPQGAPEWAWTVLRRLKLHRLEWGQHIDAPLTPETSDDLFTRMVTVLATAWGHCVPLICEFGVEALTALARGGRVREAVHCLAYVIRVMAAAHESIAHTPQFGELCTSLMESSPSLMQRAFGRGGVHGSALLLSLLVEQLNVKRSEKNVLALFSAWAQLCRGHPTLVEAALVCCHDCPDLDQQMALLLQEQDFYTQMHSSVASVSPTVCVHTLRSHHAEKEVRTGLWPRLLDALDVQRRTGSKTHVDKALQNLGAKFRADELVVHRTAAAVLLAPPSHPSHLLLWQHFFYLYLQRPPSSMDERTPPIGSLFFDGLIKTRTLSYLKKNLQETAAYHKGEVVRIKTELGNSSSRKDPTAESRPHERPTVIEPIKTEYDTVGPLTLSDLTGDCREEPILEASSSDDSKCSDEDTAEPRKVLVNMTLVMHYHQGAERACRAYLQWLNDGDKTRASPHHAEVSVYISHQAINAAWIYHVKSITPPSVVEETSIGSRRTALPTQMSPLQRLMRRLRKYQSRSRRSRLRCTLYPPISQVPTNARALVTLVEKLLKDVVQIADEWQHESQRLSALNSALCELVCSLRVHRPFTPMQRRCPKRCALITLVIPGHESCISQAAERGITENRYQAMTALQRLVRPKARAAVVAAALQTVARRVHDVETARRVVELAWASAVDRVGSCAPARDIFTTLVNQLCQRYISSDGVLCAEMVPLWCSTGAGSVQQTLSSALVAPDHLAPAHVPVLYSAILRADVPPHLAFRHLSKFEITKWAEVAEPMHRGQMLNAITSAALNLGPHPPDQHHVLLELLCVHMCALCDGRSLRVHVMQCARAASAAMLPAVVWRHIDRCAQVWAQHIPSQELTTMFRELSVLWWSVRTNPGADVVPMQPVFAEYAPHFLMVMRTFVHVLEHSLRANTQNTPEHVSWVLWSCVSEVWSPWVLEHGPATPLLPSTERHREDVLDSFVEIINDILSMTTDGKARLLQEVFVWMSGVLAAGGGGGGGGAGGGGGNHALVARVTSLPWRDITWYNVRCTPAALQLCALDQEARSFCRQALLSVDTAGWLAGVRDADLAPHLAALLHLFTRINIHGEKLEVCRGLPWHRLPLVALEPELEQYFMVHHSATVQYHNLPHFRVVLCASEMYQSAYSARETAHEKRLSLVSYWVRAVAGLHARDVIAASTAAILDTISKAFSEPVEEDKVSDELVELLGRAITILCTEPAATSAIQVWQGWVSDAAPLLVRAAVSAVGTLGPFNYFADLSDHVLRAYLATPESSWKYVLECWRGGSWVDPAPLLGRGALLTGYVRAVQGEPPALQRAVHALNTTSINFVEMEVGVALWTCRVARAVWEESAGSPHVVVDTGRTLLATWAEERRLSLLQAITMSKSHDKPTPKLRLLARLALCVVSPSEAAAKAYRSTNSALAANNSALGDTISWANQPTRAHLPRLAMMLYPASEHCFNLEFEAASR